MVVELFFQSTYRYQLTYVRLNNSSLSLIEKMLYQYFKSLTENIVRDRKNKEQTWYY